MTATERDGREMDAEMAAAAGEGTAQCAVRGAGETSDGDANARPRGRAREVSGESAQSQLDSASPVDLNKVPAPVTWSDRIGRAAATFSPPDIWSTDRPSLQLVWAYAARGDWTRPDGVPRRAAQIYALVVAVPVVAVAYSLAWAAERGSRLAALIVLLVLLAQVPPLSWLI